MTRVVLVGNSGAGKVDPETTAFMDARDRRV